MKQIVCIAPTRWGANAERTQRLLQMLPDAKIIYFEVATAANPGKCYLKRYSREAKKPHPDITVYRVPTIYYHELGHTLLEKRSFRRAAAFIAAKLRRHHLREAMLWCATPVLAEYLDMIPHKGMIYDCYRSWEKYPDQWESQLAYDADIVLAASENLLEHVTPCNRNSFLVPFGVDYALHAQGKDPQPYDAAFEGLEAPIFGYLGNVGKGVHLMPLIRCAQNHPDWNFVIIGRVKRGHVDLPELKKCSNIHCIGSRREEEIPACISRCDACFDLLHNDLADEDVVPERIYAYLAAEKPVACLYPRRYVPDFPDVIYGAQSSEEFDSACLRAANELGRRKRGLRGEYARQADWSIRGRTLNQILHDNGLM